MHIARIDYIMNTIFLVYATQLIFDTLIQNPSSNFMTINK